jgi:3-methyl-2-oxobutanoate hydroxymethyltransferase
MFSIVLEKIPECLGKEITDALSIPIIGIGNNCDCQILASTDMLGITDD